MSDKMDIDQLIKKFYDGMSTPEEERFLTDFFLGSANVDVHWKTDRQLFEILQDEAVQVPEGVSRRLEATIDELGSYSQVPVVKRRLLPRWIAGTAAILLLCMGLFFVTQQNPASPLKDTFEDPAEAALVAEQTLAYMSLYLNKGLNQAADAGQEIEKANRILNKHLK